MLVQCWVEEAEHVLACGQPLIINAVDLGSSLANSWGYV